MEPASEGGRNLVEVRGATTDERVAAMEPAPEGGEEPAVHDRSGAVATAPQWSPPRKAGGTSETHVQGELGVHAAMEPAQEGGRNRR